MISTPCRQWNQWSRIFEKCQKPCQIQFLPLEARGLPSNTWMLGPTPLTTPNDSLIHSPVSPLLTWGPTDGTSECSVPWVLRKFALWSDALIMLYHTNISRIQRSLKGLRPASVCSSWCDVMFVCPVESRHHFVVSTQLTAIIYSSLFTEVIAKINKYNRLKKNNNNNNLTTKYSKSIPNLQKLFTIDLYRNVNLACLFKKHNSAGQ